jgi:SAM-dependent methyltransferase
VKWKRVVRQLIPATLIATVLSGRLPRAVRLLGGGALLSYWVVLYSRYRRSGLSRTQREFETLRRVHWDAYWRHYNEQVPTIEQEFEIWGPYHQHRHEMRYGLVADAVREHIAAGGRIVDIGCGSANVADRLTDVDATYVGLDFGGPQIAYAYEKWSGVPKKLRTVFARFDAARIPLHDGVADVVVMSEVIEHLIRPEEAVWEIARILKPGGVFVMTTNNASEVPLKSPVSDLFAWLEKALGATRPSWISYRPWIWPERVDPALVPPDADGDIHLPHTHHIFGETSAMFAAAGLETERWLTFEFPPPQSRTARQLSTMDATGRKVADVIEVVARSLPLVRRLGTHLFVVARKTNDPVEAHPPAGVWPGPLSSVSA